MLHGHPLSASLPDDPGFGERFWYWRGASGQSYIHSIYSPESYPPVGGAVFVAVRKVDGMRKAVAVGRIPGRQDYPAIGKSEDHVASFAADEIHVHLLAKDCENADRVMRDLAVCLEREPEPVCEPLGFTRPVQLELLAA